MDTRKTTAQHERDDTYARESFSWRRMKRWQIWTLAGAAIAIVIIGLILRY